MPTDPESCPRRASRFLSRKTAPLSPFARLADIPEEEIWLAKQKSKRTRRAYKLDVRHFMRTLHITSYDELRQVDHRAVIAWERIMRETERPQPSTIRRRLAALSSLFKHLVRHGHVENNPVADVERPAINRGKASTLAFSKAEAAQTPQHAGGRHDRRPARPRHSVRGPAGRPPPRGNRRALGRRPAPEPRLRLAAHRAQGRPARRACHPPAMPRSASAPISTPPATPTISTGRCSARLVTIAKARKPAGTWTPTPSTACCGNTPAAIGLDAGYSAHSMRATFITTALENGATLDDVQKAAGHRDPAPPSSTTGAAIIRRRPPVSSRRISGVNHWREEFHVERRA